MSTLSFPWQRIQQKPENADEVHQLIGNVSNIHIAVEARQENISQKKEYLRAFIDCFHLDAWFSEADLTIVPKKQTNKQKILDQNQQTLIQKELKLFQLDNKFQIMERNFQFKISNYLYIFYWAAVIYQRLIDRQKVKQILILDVIISLNRILQKNVITEPSYLAGFEKINSKFLKIVSPRYYDLLFENPKFMTDCSFQQKNKDIALYPEQELILKKIEEAVLQDKPLLIGNEMPTGQGKSFLAVLLGKLFSLHRRQGKAQAGQKKCVLFACPNELVNEDIASNALLGDDIHLWMAKYVMTDVHEKHGSETVVVKKPVVLVRPYKRCFPSIWKKVYRSNKDDEAKMKTSDVITQWNFYLKKTQTLPDILVADLKSCELLLQAQETLGNPFVAYIDEVNTTTADNEKIAAICRYLPKQTVLLSSILPKFEYLKNIVSDFCRRHETSIDECCHRVSSAEVSIPCAIVDQHGKIRLPHLEIKKKEELVRLLSEMGRNPRIRRMYSPMHVYHWSKSLDSVIPEPLHFSVVFPQIGMVQLRNTIDYVLELLQFWIDHWETHTEDFLRYQPVYCNSVSLENIFTSESCMYDGRTLVITDNIVPDVHDLTKKLYSDISHGRLKVPSERYIKFSKRLDDRDKMIKRNEKALKNASGGNASKGKINGTKVSKLEMMMQSDDIQNELPTTDLVIDPDFVINSKEHFEKFHPGEKATFDYRVCPFMNEVYFSAFADDHLYQMFSGIGIYDKKTQTDFQRDLVMRQYSNYAFFCSGIDIVYGTNLSGLVNIFIDESFAKKNTIPTMYQLMGRAGRRGRSYHATIFVNAEETVQKLLSMDDNSEKENEVEKFFTVEQN